MPYLKVIGAASTPMLLRVVNLVAQHDLAFKQLEAELAEDGMVIRIDLAGAADTVSPATVERLRAFVEVSAVELSERT